METAAHVDARLSAVIAVKNKRIEELEEALRYIVGRQFSSTVVDDVMTAARQALQQLPDVK